MSFLLTVITSFLPGGSSSIIDKSNQKKTYFVCHGNAKDKHNPALAVCRDCGESEELKP